LQGNDIALLELERSPQCYNEDDGPSAVLLNQGEFWPMTDIAPVPVATALGWGRVEAGGVASLNLKAVELNLYTTHQCSHVYNVQLADSNRCSGTFPHDGSDSCSGDSGGPLVVPYNGSYVQVGIVSWGYGDPVCADGDFPGVYNLVSGYEDFLPEGNRTYATYDVDLLNLANMDCSCTEFVSNCTSGGVLVNDICGCSEHNADESPFCYIEQPDKCPSALHSILYNGAAWLFCSPLTGTVGNSGVNDPGGGSVDDNHHHQNNHLDEEYYWINFTLYIVFLLLFLGLFFSVMDQIYKEYPPLKGSRYSILHPRYQQLRQSLGH
jgi:hypothetical protein